MCGTFEGKDVLARTNIKGKGKRNKYTKV